MKRKEPDTQVIVKNSQLTSESSSSQSLTSHDSPTQASAPKRRKLTEVKPETLDTMPTSQMLVQPLSTLPPSQSLAKKPILLNLAQELEVAVEFSPIAYAKKLHSLSKRFKNESIEFNISNASHLSVKNFIAELLHVGCSLDKIKKITSALHDQIKNKLLAELAYDYILRSKIANLEILSNLGLNLEQVINPANSHHNLFFAAAQLKDQGAMLKYLIAKLGISKAKHLARVIAADDTTPIILAAEKGDLEGFKILDELTCAIENNLNLRRAVIKTALRSNADIYNYMKEKYCEQLPSFYYDNHQMTSPVAPAAVKQPHQMKGSQAPQAAANIAPLNNSVESNTSSVTFSGQITLAQTAISNLDLVKALQQSIENGLKSSVSTQISDHLKILKGLLKAHEIMTKDQRSSSSSNSIGK